MTEHASDILDTSSRTRTETTRPQEHDSEAVAIGPRRVEFDWSDTPMHYMDGSPLATHLINVMHLLLPEGEEWFVRVFQEALPLIDDEDLRRDVIGFIGQESVHATAHASVHSFLRERQLDPGPYLSHVSYLFRIALGPRPIHTLNSLIERLAIVAAIEHLTAFLGHWVLTEPALDTAEIDPTMLDLLRWHGAEEVEHRSVAFDVLQHFDKRRFRRIRTFAMVLPMMVVVWIRGVRFLMQHDPTLDRESRAVRSAGFRTVAKRGLAPSLSSIIRSSKGYLEANYHPHKHGSTATAVAYLAVSPAARAVS